MLVLTTMARHALVAATGLDALEVLRIQIGSGSGPGGDTDAGRQALRALRDSAAANPANGPAGSVAITALIEPTADYDVTEAGLWGRIDGTEMLVAYWSDGGTAIAAARTGGEVEIAAVLDLRSAAGPAVTFRRDVPGPPGPPGDCADTEADLVDCQASLGACETARQTAEASLATCETARQTAEASLATCETARQTAQASLAACELALMGEHLVTAPGATTFAWPWAHATLARVVCYGAGQAGEGRGGADGGSGGATSVSYQGQAVTANGGSGRQGLDRDAHIRATWAGGNGGRGDNSSPGQPGRAGDVVDGTIAGLTLGAELSITVGAGGEIADLPTDNLRATDGGPGLVLILPRR